MKLIDFLRSLGVDVPKKLPLDKYGSSDDDYVAKCCAEHGNACHDQWANLEISHRALDKYELIPLLEKRIPGYKNFDNGTKMVIAEEICALSIPTPLPNKEKLTLLLESYGIGKDGINEILVLSIPEVRKDELEIIEIAKQMKEWAKIPGLNLTPTSIRLVNAWADRLCFIHPKTNQTEGQRVLEANGVIYDGIERLAKRRENPGNPEVKQASNHEEMCGIHDGSCHVCGEQTNSYSAFPSIWSIFLPHIDGQDKHRYYHVKCLYPILNSSIQTEVK